MHLQHLNALKSMSNVGKLHYEYHVLVHAKLYDHIQIVREYIRIMCYVCGNMKLSVI